uniref:Hyccin n=1 Tax=Kalanchoe fedtschenkoi TaxID=63787 RepID=A0A7N0ZXT9_KALFE
MDHHHHHPNATASPSSSYSSTTTATTANLNSATTITSTATNLNGVASNDPMHAWWESISKARTRIHSLASILRSVALSSLADSDHPARALLLSPEVYSAVSEALSSPDSGSGSDPLCQWLYETFQFSDPDLRLIVYAYVPLICGVYMSRVVSAPTSDPSASAPSLVGFEAVLLAIYGLEVKARAGKPVVVSIPDLSQPSLYHTPREKAGSGAGSSRPVVGVVCGPLEAQNAVKSTKRAAIAGAALDCYFKQIAHMPSWSKVEFCEYVAAWAGQHCKCETELDEQEEEVIDGFSEIRISVEGRDDEEDEDDVVVERNGKVGLGKNGDSSFASKGKRIPLPWELLQPVLRILGHCLLGPLNPQDVKDSASVAVRRLYARASHDLVPQGILATRSLIQLDNRMRKTANEAGTATSVSNVNTPSKAKKPEVLLVSK